MNVTNDESVMQGKLKINSIQTVVALSVPLRLFLKFMKGSGLSVVLILNLLFLVASQMIALSAIVW